MGRRAGWAVPADQNLQMHTPFVGQRRGGTKILKWGTGQVIGSAIQLPNVLENKEDALSASGKLPFSLVCRSWVDGVR